MVFYTLLGLTVLVAFVLGLSIGSCSADDTCFKATRAAWREAACALNERAAFEMADAEGTSLDRFHRARPLHELELEFRSRASRADVPL